MKSIKKEPLFELIKSLSKSEKRYFYILSKHHEVNGKNNYLFLFEIINKFDVYNDKEVKKSIKNTIAEKDFVFTKSYLYKRILKSLNAFHKERISIDSSLSELTLSIEILYNKALYTQALKLCKKGIKTAILHEKFEINLILEKWQHKILEKLNIENIKHYQSVSSKKIELIVNTLSFKILSDNIYKHVNRLGISRSTKEIKSLNNLINSPLLTSERNANSISSKILYNRAKGLYSYFNGNYKESNRLYKRSLQLFLENKDFANSNPGIYISTYNNLTISSLHLGKKEETKKNIQHLKNHATSLREGQLKVTTYSNIFSIEIPFYINQGDFKEGCIQFKGILEIWKKYEQKFNPIQNVFTQYFIAYLYFGNRQYKESLKWLNQIINSPKINNRDDIFVFARLLVLIAHFELGNTEFLEYQLRSIKTFLSKKERNYHIEKSAILLLKDLVLKNQSKIDTFNLHKSKFQNYFENEKHIFGYFNFLAWIDNNTSNISFENAHRKYI